MQPHHPRATAAGGLNGAMHPLSPQPATVESSSHVVSMDVSQPPGPATLENAHFNHSLYFIEHLFPSKLWRILDDAERCGYDNVISWVDNGMAFQIRK
jgi:hypothetical protein